MEFDGKTEKEMTRDDIKAPEGWLWKTDWAIDKNRAVDEDGACVCVCWRVKSSTCCEVWCCLCLNDELLLT